jgi:ABC-type proline/glycine betaine transport systems, periplasmic components
MARSFLIVLLVLLMFGSCPALASATGNGRKTLKIVYVDWDCAIASSNLAKAVLEDKLGYRVELVPVNHPTLWNRIAGGEADAMTLRLRRGLLRNLPRILRRQQHGNKALAQRFAPACRESGLTVNLRAALSAQTPQTPAHPLRRKP